MKLRLPSRLVHALLTTCAAALTTNAPVFADVPEDYTPVIITNVDQLANYTKADFIAFIISSDITDSAYRMMGAHQYWTDDVLHSHILTFCEFESSTGYGAIDINKELVVQKFEQLCFACNSSAGFGSAGGAICDLSSSAITLNENEIVTFSENSANQGGAIYTGISGSASITENGTVMFSGNSADSYGGAIDAARSGTVSFTGNGTVTFSENSANLGGAIYTGISGSASITENGTVLFSGNSADSDGGAIYAPSSSTVNFTDNDAVTFSKNSAYDGGAISANSSTVNFTENDAVTFSENLAYNGGAIYAYSSTVNFTENDTVTFSGNTATSSGGAIYAPSSSTVSFTENGTVTFSENSASVGGAICAYTSGTVNFTDNDAVTFSGNSATSSGGAISASGTLNLTGNESVTFIGNTATSSGGAISASGTFDLTGNTSVMFSGNSASSSGGAISASGTLNLTGNESVTFIGNTATSSGGAISASGTTLNIAGNGRVVFQGNYEQSGSGDSATYRLRSVRLAHTILKLAAGAGQDITFYDTLYADTTSTVSFNAKYVDKDGVEQEATGDIVFSGKYAEEDLMRLKPNYTQKELTNSLTTEVLTTSNLHGGRLSIEDGAIYKGYGINVAAGSNATLRLANGELNQTYYSTKYDVTLASGTTLDLLGVNKISAGTLDMQDGSIMSFTLGETNLTEAALTLDGTFNQGGKLTISIQGDKTYGAEDKYMLISMASGVKPQTWDMSKITLVGENTNVNHLKWESGVLFYDTDMPPLVTATWSGTQSREWNFSEKNWTQDGDRYRYKNGVDVVFGDTGSGEVVLADAVTPLSVLVENSAGHDYSFAGEGSLAGATTLTKEGAGKLTIATANTYEGGTVINGGTVALGSDTALGTGDIQLNDGVLDLGGNTIANNIITPEDAIVTIGNGTTTGNLSLAYTELTITGNLQVAGEIQADLENMITVEYGATLGISQAIVNTGDYLEIAGRIDVSKMHGEVEGPAFYTGGEDPANGFRSALERVVLVNNISGGEVYIGDANFIYKGEEIQVDDNFVAEVYAADHTLFCVNENAEKLSTALDGAAAAQETLATVEMKSGTKLHVDRDTNDDLIQVESGTATMDIAKGVTLSETDSSRTDFILEGQGRYSLMSGSNTLGAAMGDTWQGIVQINGAAFSSLDLNDYGKEIITEIGDTVHSTVSLNGVSAKLVASTTFIPRLELLGEGLTITDCTSSGQTYVFAGGVSGDGNMVFNPGGMRHRQTYVFTGDVSQWFGTYENMAANRNSTLVFYGDATEIGAAIKQTAGSINVEVGNGSDAHISTFMNEVEATDFTVSEQATAVLASDTAVTGKMTVLGSLEVKDGGNLALAQDATVSVGDSYTITGKGGTAPVLSGNMEIKEAGFYGKGKQTGRIDHSVVKLEEASRVEFNNVILGATSRLTDDPATVVANNMVIEGQYGVNVEEGAPMTIKSGSIMQRLGQPSELIELDSDASACRLDITNVESVNITGNCLTIDLSGMYPALYDYSRKYDWLGISLGSGDQVAMLDTNMVVELKLNDRLHPRAYYLSSVGWGGADFIMPVANGENVGIIYIDMFDVPEPTTSTLSLLALAALAARRKRK